MEQAIARMGRGIMFLLVLNIAASLVGLILLYSSQQEIIRELKTTNSLLRQTGQRIDELPSKLFQGMTGRAQ